MWPNIAKEKDMSTPADLPAADPSLSSAINNLASAIQAGRQTSEKPEKLWNSLESTKLIVSALTPILLLIVGIYVTQVEHHQEALTAARVKSYDTIKDNLNRIHCYVADRGPWKEETPDTVIGYKRAVDREMYEEKGIWSDATFAAYIRYTEAAFKMSRGPGQDPQIRSLTYQKSTLSTWKQDFADKFATPDPKYQQAYDDMYKAFFHDITH